MIQLVISAITLIWISLIGISGLKGCTEPVEAATLASLPSCEKKLLDEGFRLPGHKAGPITARDVELVQDMCTQDRTALLNHTISETQKKALGQ